MRRVALTKMKREKEKERACPKPIFNPRKENYFRNKEFLRAVYANIKFETPNRAYHGNFDHIYRFGSRSPRPPMMSVAMRRSRSGEDVTGRSWPLFARRPFNDRPDSDERASVSVDEVTVNIENRIAAPRRNRRMNVRIMERANDASCPKSDDELDITRCHSEPARACPSGRDVFLHENTQRIVRVITKRSPTLISGRRIQSQRLMLIGSSL